MVTHKFFYNIFFLLDMEVHFRYKGGGFERVSNVHLSINN